MTMSGQPLTDALTDLNGIYCGSYSVGSGLKNKVCDDYINSEGSRFTVSKGETPH